MRYWKEEEVIKIRSTREEEVLKVEEQEEEEEEEEGEEGKGGGRRQHAKLVRQSRVKESMSPRSIRSHPCSSQSFYKEKTSLSISPANVSVSVFQFKKKFMTERH